MSANRLNADKILTVSVIVHDDYTHIGKMLTTLHQHTKQSFDLVIAINSSPNKVPLSEVRFMLIPRGLIIHTGQVRSKDQLASEE